MMNERSTQTEEFKDSPLGNIPSDWDIGCFEDVSKLSQGLQIAISKRFKDYKPGRYIYITVEYLNNLSNSNILEFIETKNTRVICYEDDVLVTRTGATGKIISIFDSHSDRIQEEEAHRDKLKLQKKGLMQDLLTGKVRVK